MDGASKKNVFAGMVQNAIKARYMAFAYEFFFLHSHIVLFFSHRWSRLHSSYNSAIVRCRLTSM